ncbi:MAG TPA: hypothetical protein VEL76_35630 [Gemmataceae bacterium]|nr:hypothetical protein [Gemmataceae bacterium]
MVRYTSLLGSVLFVAVAAGAVQELTPVREGVVADQLREHCRRLLKAIKALDGPLPAATVNGLEALLARKSVNPEMEIETIQQLLDPHCLVSVTINPESRVKAARGAAEALLLRDRDVFFLVKVHNEAGVTHALTATGPQLRGEIGAGKGRWLEGTIHGAAPLAKTLSGARVEYALLRLRAYETGKREATLAFDVGQGTQDLGFRAEVPILFTVREAKR